MVGEGEGQLHIQHTATIRFEIRLEMDWNSLYSSLQLPTSNHTSYLKKVREREGGGGQEVESGEGRWQLVVPPPP